MRSVARGHGDPGRNVFDNVPAFIRASGIAIAQISKKQEPSSSDYAPAAWNRVMSNLLAQSRSPYLLQHRDNPVEWYPWGDEALEKARREDRPIFLSIGYAACHWCHVMERESFENAQIAQLLNDRFVCVKVDREERPDLDAIYMNAVQMMTGSGGWPMSVFLTPELKPFYAGTYFPPSRRGGMPGFDEVIIAVADAWENRRDACNKQASELTVQLRQIATGPAHGGAIPPAEAIDHAAARLHSSLDRKWGGFGSPPKFPHVSDLELLLRRGHRTENRSDLDAVKLTLTAMARGGMYDVLGGGFARYSVDGRWLVPHFEKMLYDNGLLAGLYLEAYQATGEANLATVARQTLSYVLDELADPAGGLHSSEDADSEGEEGRYYVWSAAEIRDVLGDHAAPFMARYGVTEEGNFEGHNILVATKDLPTVAAMFGNDPDELREQIEESRQRLLAVRHGRVRPGRDDKILVAWNAMAIRALALGGRVLEEACFTSGAARVADFLLSEMRQQDGRLIHAWHRGTAHLNAYLDDYAYLIDALVTLYETTGQPRWIQHATDLADTMLRQFEDRDAGGFFYTADDHETLIARTKDWHDSSTPSSNGTAVVALLRLGRLTLRDDFLQAAERTLIAAAEVITRQSPAAGRLITALDHYHFGGDSLVIAAPEEASLDAVLRHYFARFRPNTSLGWVVGGPPADGPLAALLGGKPPVDGQVTAYNCRHHTCGPPIVGEPEVVAVL